MTILSAQTIKREMNSFFQGLIITPFFAEKQIFKGMSFGLSSAGYDFRLNLNGVEGVVDNCYVMKPRENLLASLIEYISLPKNILVTFENKSTLIRNFITVHNTVFEPGWFGYATVEISNLNDKPFTLYHGQPIGQGIFHYLDMPTEKPYMGKYQNQPDHPIPARLEG